MGSVKSYIWILIGIIVSLSLPVLSAEVRTIFKTEVTEIAAPQFWYILKPYLVTSIFAMLTALVLLASIVRSGGKINSWADALLYGFAWDSILQKLITG